MSDNRKRPIARRFKPETEALLQAYAKSRNITANEAAEQLLHGNSGVVVDAAAEIKSLRAEVAWHKRREKDIVTACERVADGGQFRADIVGAIHRIRDERDAATRAAEQLRADLESAREATRRADQALESSHRSNRILAGRADAAEAEVARLTRELAGERLKTEAAQARRSSAAPCACALPDDFEAKLAARAPGWKGTPAELRARVIQLGFSRYDALATDAAKRAAERGR